MKDAQLVERARQGDAKAFEVLVRRHQAMAYAVAMSRLADPGLAEEVAQEAFLKTWRELGSLRNPERFGVWLRAIVRRLAGRFCLGTISRQDHDLISYPLPVGVNSYAMDLKTNGEERDDLRLVREILDRLPVRYREIITMHDLLGRKATDVARDLGVSEEVVRQRLLRGRHRLGDGWDEQLRKIQTRNTPRATFASGVSSIIMATLALGSVSPARAQAVSAIVVSSGMMLVIVPWMLKWPGWISLVGTVLLGAWILWFRPRFLLYEDLHRRILALAGISSLYQLGRSEISGWMLASHICLLALAVLALLPDLYPGSFRVQRFYENLFSGNAYRGAFTWADNGNESKPLPSHWYLLPLMTLAFTCVCFVQLAWLICDYNYAKKDAAVPASIAIALMGWAGFIVTVHWSILGLRRYQSQIRTTPKKGLANSSPEGSWAPTE